MRWLGSFFITLSLLISSAAAVTAASPTMVASEPSSIAGSRIMTGDRVVINQASPGEIFIFANTVEIAEVVDGDVIIFANHVRVTGQILGNLRGAVNTLVIDGEVTDNVSVMASSLEITELGVVGESVSVAAERVRVDGRVDGTVNSLSKSLRVAGQVGQVEARGQQLEIQSSASISGQVVGKVQTAEISPAATLAYTPEVEVQPTREATRGGWSNVVRAWWWVPFGSLLIGAGAWVLLWPRMHAVVTRQFLSRFWPNVVWGMIILVLVPMVLILLALTIIGLPLAILLLGLYIISLLLASWVAAAGVGAWIAQKMPDQAWLQHPLVQVGVGVGILWLLSLIPFLGWLVWVGVWLAGLGSLFTTWWAHRQAENRIEPVVVKKVAPAPVRKKPGRRRTASDAK